ncbi:MAG: uracil-DNA glycosylase [Actinomycetes bacterium]
MAEQFASPVLPGTGWPDDPATPTTPVARDRVDVLRVAAAAGSLAELDAAVSVCRACPRLVAWREDVAVTKRRSFADQPYWGRPIHGWGDERPAVLIVGLAPAAHGGNRTGRIFTGDRSGDWLFAALHRAGLATRPTSTHAGDGQRLVGTRMLAAVRCAPPANVPTPDERDTCAPWLDAELALLRDTLRVVVALGGFAWQATLAAMSRAGHPVPRPRPRFGHGAEVELGGLLVLGSFHPSQQNTFTGKLTEPMLDDVFRRAVQRSGPALNTLGS